MSLLGIALVSVALVVAGCIAFLPGLRRSESWQATVIPLASIMGSGFLVSAPLLGSVVGRWAMPAMAALLTVAYALGHVMRFNILHAEHDVEAPEPPSSSDHKLQRAHRSACSASKRTPGAVVERLSHMVLAMAYVVSIAYYLQLLAAFALGQLGITSVSTGHLVAGGIVVGLTAIGALFGLGLLERLDRFAIALNLGVVTAILVGLVAHNVQLLSAGDWALPPAAGGQSPLETGRILMGLLIVVQGFETSRFLGSEHSKEIRVRTMRWAQLIASGIYIVFLGLITVINGPTGASGADVTAVITLLTPVAPVLPMLVVISAIVSQFSAAVADDSGNVGLVQTLLGGRGPSWLAYILIGLAAGAVIFLTDPVQVIAWASRAFALFYALQCVVASTVAWRTDVSHSGVRVVAYAALGLVALAVCIFGVPAG